MLLITSSAASYCLLVLGVLKQIAALTVSVSPRLQWLVLAVLLHLKELHVTT